MADTKTITLPNAEKVIIDGNPSDGYFQAIANSAEGLAGMIKVCQSHIKSEGVILDIGANIGLSTIYLASMFPSRQIVAFEPSPENFIYLVRNVKLNNIENVTLFQKALSDKTSRLRFHEAIFGAGSHAVSMDHLDTRYGAVDVQAMTLDDFIGDNPKMQIAFCKIDAEGHEPNILAGGRKTFMRDRPFIFMEFNSWCLNAFGGHSPAAFAKSILKYFHTYHVDTEGRLTDAGDNAVDLLHRNIIRESCVSDLVLRVRDNLSYPSLAEMVWPPAANNLIKTIQVARDGIADHDQ